MRNARAEAACDGGKPWISIQLLAPGWSSAQRQRVLQNLEHIFAAQGIDACSDGVRAKGDALATLSIDIGPETRASVDIEVRDAVTHKRVGRDVDLSSIPSDGRELAVAIEADELLRASWAELALDTERARSATPDPRVVQSVGQALAPSRVRRQSALGARMAGEYYPSSETALLGADALGRIPLGPRLALEISAAFRTSPPSSVEHGVVRAFAAGGALRILARIAESGAVSLDAGAGLAGSWLQFRADPEDGAEGSPYTDLLMVGRLGLVGRVALGTALEFTTGLGGGRTLRGVQATDAGQVVAGATGLELAATLGLEAR
jgi:hypothetical protein